jgi:toxin-antitoxin system PIN domain toxin
LIYLLDVNLLIALLDANHIHYTVAHDWFKRIGSRGWATCPITENGFLRIVASPTYPNSFGSPETVFEVLRDFCARKDHHFWPDDFSVLEIELVQPAMAMPSRHVTDLYLLSLANRHQGRLATFDRRIPLDLISHGKTGIHLVAG